MAPVMLIILIVINIKQDVLEGFAAAGIEPGTFPPASSGEPGKGLPNVPRNPRKLSTLEKQKFQEL